MAALDAAVTQGCHSQDLAMSLAFVLWLQDGDISSLLNWHSCSLQARDSGTSPKEVNLEESWGLGVWLSYRMLV